MRGKDRFHACDMREIGITPAYAGKSEEDHRPTQKKQDHPAYAGKSFTSVFQHVEFIGITPPMRGKADVVLNRIDRIGITPPMRGKATDIFGQLTQLDHPAYAGKKRKIKCF